MRKVRLTCISAFSRCVVGLSLFFSSCFAFASTGSLFPPPYIHTYIQNRYNARDQASVCFFVGFGFSPLSIRYYNIQSCYRTGQGESESGMCTIPEPEPEPEQKTLCPALHCTALYTPRLSPISDFVSPLPPFFFLSPRKIQGARRRNCVALQVTVNKVGGGNTFLPSLYLNSHVSCS